MFHPARPSLMWSSDANARARVNGWLYPVDAVAMRPIRSVTAAIAASRVIGSKTVVTLCSRRCPTARVSAKKTASSLPRSAIRASS